MTKRAAEWSADPKSSKSAAEQFALLDPQQRAQQIDAWGESVCADKPFDWRWWERPDQRAPAGDWHIWLAMAGRAFGKTRMGAEWVRARAEEKGKRRIALVGATMAEVRSIMIEGESGLLRVSPDPPVFEPSLKRLRWPNGTIAEMFSAAEPDGLRGAQHDFAWADELGKWDKSVEAWDNLMLGLRLGESPRAMITTTPRPIPLLRRLLREKGVIRTGGSSLSNSSNLTSTYFDIILRRHQGTRLGRQEIDGELIEVIEGALWEREWIEAARVSNAPALTRVVIGVDPPATATGDACGIVAVGLGLDGKAYVLGDHSVSGLSPAGWASAVAAAAEKWSADKVVAEANNGGDMVISTLRGADVNMPVKKVHATHGKVTRAEPVAALYERGEVAHVGGFPALEDELCGFVTGGYEGPGRSPDRADACVWALNELMLGKAAMVPRVRGF